MAYPFSPMPTLGEFIKNSENKYGAQLKVSKKCIEGPEGPHYPKYLIRIYNNNRYHSVLPDCDDDQVLTPTVLRRSCMRLGVPLSDYGLTLTDKGWEDVNVD